MVGYSIFKSMLIQVLWYNSSTVCSYFELYLGTSTFTWKPQPTISVHPKRRLIYFIFYFCLYYTYYIRKLIKSSANAIYYIILHYVIAHYISHSRRNASDYDKLSMYKPLQAHTLKNHQVKVILLVVIVSSNENLSN